MKQRVLRILEQAGLKADGPFMKTSGGQRNQSWVCGNFVVRMNDQKNSQVLRLETELLARVAEIIPCPKVYAVGVDQFGEWMVQQKVAGRPLAHVWPQLDSVGRKQVVAQLARFVRTLHQFKADDLGLPFFPTFQELHDQIVARVELCRNFPFVDSALMDGIVVLSLKLSQLLVASEQVGLVHGDLHFDNILWDGQRITAILDFEKARIAPLEAEMDLFLRYCAFPQLFVQEEYEHLTCAADYNDVPLWFAEAYPELFQVEHLVERLSMYSLAYDLSLLELFPPRKVVDLHEEDELMNRLRAVVEQSGYLSPKLFWLN